eukprot:GILJ01007857.1.p1 GENE.GILJ01007857.1~~GILJ01007857.1.p1  ORF type:complete len:644 (-),score=74.22 GILJ01007857.1:42-1973(-)
MGNHGSQLRRAVRQCDRLRIEYLVRKDRSCLEARDKHGRTPLLAAIDFGYYELVTFLIHLEADISAVDKECNGVLLWSTYMAHDGISLMLIDVGAPIDQHNLSGRTPLMWACAKGSFDVVWKLIESGANIHRQDKNMFQPLHYAALNGHREVLWALITKGADINSVNKFGHSPLMMAVAESRIAVAKLLLESGANVYLRDHKNLFAFDFVKLDEMGRLLAEFNISIQPRSATDATPLPPTSVQRSQTAPVSSNGYNPTFTPQAPPRSSVSSVYQHAQAVQNPAQLNGISQNSNSVLTSSSQNASTSNSSPAAVPNNGLTTVSADRPPKISTASYNSIHRMQLCSWDELIHITDHFSSKRKIGEGGFGDVYIAKWRGITVAIKRLNLKNSLQGEREFLQEVSVLRALRHPNIVRLLGCVVYMQERCMLFEYKDGGTLEKRLTVADGAPLPWSARFMIALEIARGLAFLHEEIRPPVLHRDLKSANIFLDHNGTACIGDFGLSSHVESMQSADVYGTHGYIDPGFLKTGIYSSASDVYSFGVILMELFTGQPSISATRSPRDLASWFNKELASDSTSSRLMDVRAGAIDVAVSSRWVELIQSCVRDEPTRRPSMLEVVSLIQFLQKLSFDVDKARLVESKFIFSP